ncbi:MAG: hypothetical protein ACI4PT_02025 [Candidatus Avoscillospira sp.]
MIRQFILDCKLHWKGTFLAQLLADLGGFLFGVILLNIILRLDDTAASWFCMGTIMAMIVSVIFTLFYGAFGYHSEFQLALSMGRTRMAFMGSYALRLLLQMVAGYVMILLLYRLEGILYSLLFPDCMNDAPFTFLTNWKVLVPIALGILILSMFVGAIYGRWGKKSLWFFWVVWMFCCFVLPRLFDDELGDGILDQAALGMRNVFTVVPLRAWIVVSVILAVGMVSTTVSLGRKQMVKI